MNAIFPDNSDEPVYATQQLTVDDCWQLHHLMQINTAANGDMTATWEINKMYPQEQLTSVARGTGF